MTNKQIRHKFTWRGLLAYIDAETEFLFPMSRQDLYKMTHNSKIINWEDYFPSEIIRAANRLERKGFVTIEKISTGTKVKITDKGKTEILKFNLDQLAPKTGIWDGKWRLVFFDIEEKNHNKRNRIVKYLKQLGLQEMQKSLYVSPYDISSEIKFIREVFSVPHCIKYDIMEYLENSEDLKQLFDL